MSKEELIINPVENGFIVLTSSEHARAMSANPKGTHVFQSAKDLGEFITKFYETTEGVT